MTTKTCSKCRIEKPISEYYLRKSECKPCIAVKRHARYNARRSIERASHDVWRAANPEVRRASKAKWNAANRDHNKEVYAVWYQADPERTRSLSQAKFARQYAADPGKFIERQDIRRRGLVVVERVDRAVVFARDGARCGICGWGPLNPDRWDLDHVIPVSKGGVHSYANVQSSHPYCNDSKGAKITT